LLQRSDKNNIGDVDGHPLAGLCLKRFNEVGRRLDKNWLQRDVEQKLVSHSKRAREEGDSKSSILQKSGRLAYEAKASSLATINFNFAK